MQEDDIQHIGVISDTHGVLRESVREALKGTDLILHAGDIGGREVVRALEALAPVRLVRGNTDIEPWSVTLPPTDIVEVGQVRLLMLHDLANLAVDPSNAGIDAVISGHSHRPHRYEKKGVLFFNPGSAGPRRFRLPICVGLLSIRGKTIEARHVDLPD